MQPNASVLCKGKTILGILISNFFIFVSIKLFVLTVHIMSFLKLFFAASALSKGKIHFKNSYFLFFFDVCIYQVHMTLFFFERPFLSPNKAKFLYSSFWCVNLLRNFFDRRVEKFLSLYKAAQSLNWDAISEGGTYSIKFLYIFSTVWFHRKGWRWSIWFYLF